MLKVVPSTTRLQALHHAKLYQPPNSACWSGAAAPCSCQHHVPEGLEANQDWGLASKSVLKGSKKKVKKGDAKSNDKNKGPCVPHAPSWQT